MTYVVPPHNGRKLNLPPAQLVSFADPTADGTSYSRTSSQHAPTDGGVSAAAAGTAVGSATLSGGRF